MHGRQRVERSPEEEAKKEKEREVKVKAYMHVMGKIFAKRSKGELDSEMLLITGKVLAGNPDIHTLWNIRKETLRKMKEEDGSNFVEKVVPNELDFTEMCLKSNPKSYGAWHHRCWIMRETDFKRTAEELKLCAKYLEYDDRNFHTWDYRRFLLDNSSFTTLEEELKFTTEKISSNFSNFSSWHLRSKILPQLVEEEFLERELELVRNAAFTDPKDQSAWLYHLWLLKSNLIKETPQLTLVEVTGRYLLLRFNVPVPAPKLDEVHVGDMSLLSWQSPLHVGRSKLWMMEFRGPIIGNEVKLSGSYIHELFTDNSVTMKVGSSKRIFLPFYDEETKPKPAKFENILKEELVWVEELRELEPEIKWPIYTAMILMRMINFVKYKPQIIECLEQLVQIDAKRLNYYNDLRSKFILEWLLVDQNNLDDGDATTIDLSGLGLTALYYPERLCDKKIVNCSNNALKIGASFASLVSCTSLDIQNNNIPIDLTLMNLIRHLPYLESLRCSGNPGFVAISLLQGGGDWSIEIS